MTTGPANTPGITYTFYSYKGGVGRSMACANMAALLAKWGYSVLVVDWDLEAPGLERFFFNSHLNSVSVQSKPGIVDLIIHYADGSALDWKECIQSIELVEAKPLSFISAGRKTDDYLERMQSIDFRR